MFPLLPLSVFTLLTLFTPTLSEKTNSKVAVLEFSYHRTDPCPSFLCSREEALRKVQPNIHDYRYYARLAARKGVKLIVFPEDGIHGFGFSRKTIEPFLENIPDPKKVNWWPCQQHARFSRTEIQKELSCIAQENSIFLIANLGHKAPCNTSSDLCPPEGAHQYNTDVIFGPDGKLLARYHKRHLYGNESTFYDPIPHTENIYLDTGLPGVGRIGIMTCFDSVFPDPALTLLHKYHIQTLLLPTAWWNFFPSFCAVGEHNTMAWNYGVNILAANARDSLTGNTRTGSGIYSPQGPLVYHQDLQGGAVSKLLVSKLKLPSPSHGVINWNDYATTVLQNVPRATHTFENEFNGDVYTWAAIVPGEKKHRLSTLSVCQGDFCCVLTYQFHHKHTRHELFAIGVFYGYRRHIPEYTSKICTFVQCASNSNSSCGEEVTKSKAKFSTLTLSGNFGPGYYVFPQVLMDNGNVARQPKHYQVRNDGRIEVTKASLPSLLSATLEGRHFK